MNNNDKLKQIQKLNGYFDDVDGRLIMFRELDIDNLAYTEIGLTRNGKNIDMSLIKFDEDRKFEDRFSQIFYSFQAKDLKLIVDYLADLKNIEQ